MAGFDNDTVYGTNVDFSGAANPAPTVLNKGELLIGSSIAPRIRVATLTAGAGITITNGDGSITIAATGGVTPIGGLIPDAHTAPGTTPVVGDGSGNVTVTGAQVASGVVGTNVIRTDSLAANTLTIEIQRATSAAVSTPADNGVAHFDNTIFTVGAGGFVSLVGGAVPPSQKFAIDGSTPPGTNPVVPTAVGVVTITGNQTLAGVVGARAIRTFSSAANSYEIQIQRATTAAVSNAINNGISHYDSTIFTVDANAFVSLVGGAVPTAQKFDVDAHTVPGTDPVVANASGVIVFSGNQVAAGTVATAIRTDSLAANSMTVEVQRTSAVAGSDVTKNGVAHFNSAQFTVDANGFVSSTGGGGTGAWQLIQTQAAAGVSTLVFNTNLSNFTELMFTWDLTLAVGPIRLFFEASADNGATKLSGERAFLSGGGWSTSTSTSLYAGDGQSALNTVHGYFTIQNTPGTLPRMVYGNMMGDPGTGGGMIFNILPTSAQINWINIQTAGGNNMTGSVNVFGR